MYILYSYNGAGFRGLLLRKSLWVVTLFVLLKLAQAWRACALCKY